MEYKRQVFDETWIAEFSIDHQPDVATKLVFISPDIVKGNTVIRTNDGLWVTPLSDENLERVKKEMEPFPWHRLLDNDNNLFFQAAFNLNHENLLVKNYKVTSNYNSNSKNLFHVFVEPKNKYRPTMKCKFERETLVQRSCKHYNHDKELDESFTFIELTINPTFDNQTFSLDTLKKIHSFDQSENRQEPIQPDFKLMTLQWLPLGFELIHTDVWKGRYGITHHSLYSDGFARLSVYQRKLHENELEKLKKQIKEKGEDTCVVNRLKQRGDWVYFRDMKDLRISAVGDISPKSIGKTLSKISGQ